MARQPRCFTAVLGLVCLAASSVASAHPPGEKLAAVPTVSLPFACKTEIKVSQGHGTYSHVGNDYWAWDFPVAVGTPVVAAHDGVVRMARSDSATGGCDASFGSDANYVTIERGDGLETQYLHLSRVDVRVGQSVRAGERIGLSGETGFSCGSHLHFQVQSVRPGQWANPSVQAAFIEAGDPSAAQVVVSENCGT